MNHLKNKNGKFAKNGKKYFDKKCKRDECPNCKQPKLVRSKTCFKCYIKTRDTSADKNPKWRGGIKLSKEGYYYIYAPYHPYANNVGCVLEHRLVMEKKLKRFLTPIEFVHHKNDIKTDNRIENLELLLNSEHSKYHSNKRIRNKKGQFK